jgi:aminopeptidase N
MRQFTPIYLALTVFLAACSGSKNAGKVQPVKSTASPVFHQVEAYRAARPLDMRMVHTKLYLRPDFANAWMYGTAHLTLQPHFYDADSLILDAKGFAISRVEYVGDDYFKALPYSYDGQQLRIYLEFPHAAGKNFEVLVEYIAKPNELKNVGGSTAIQGAKGLYFINGDGSDPHKPTQLWTQGETESNSCWYPTIDAPNQKTTQEIYLTVDSSFVTLSNGELVYSTDNGDGTRTDYWKQDLPHAPYLTMLAVGKFHVEKESWRGKEVSYYVEPEFAATAKASYPNTVEMLEFFSNQLGVPYPWYKYAQVSVRDYVSGAMENTTAVIFGEWAQRTERELLDGSSESTVAHELYHHWFGDLVTCESWSNISVNESFATYGSYLWDEHKYGKIKAQQGLYNNLQGYLKEAERKQVDLVRFYYKDKEDVFDRHSYAKGSLILHMLRQEVGDKAFFAALKLFLTRHAYQAVEIHQLRLAFEEITGRDMNWFFNQWFYAKGHPQLQVSKSYDDNSKELVVKIQQLQDTTHTPLYRLPMDISWYQGGQKQTVRVVLSRSNQEFRFGTARPELVVVDSRRELLATWKQEPETLEAYQLLWKNATHFRDYLTVLEGVAALKSTTEARQLFMEALAHPHAGLRVEAIALWDFTDWKNDALLIENLRTMARLDPDSRVREIALEKLGEADAQKQAALFRDRIANDSSYRVISAALVQLALSDSMEALALAKGFEGVRYVRPTVIQLYGQYGDSSHVDFFETQWAALSVGLRYGIVQAYTELALRSNDRELMGRAIGFMSARGQEESGWMKRFLLENRQKLERALPKP